MRRPILRRCLLL